MSSPLDQRRARIAACLPLEDAIFLVGAGTPVPLPEGSDQMYPFRSHAEYFYLTGQECAGGVIALDPHDHAAERWVSFVPSVTENERIWEGRGQMEGIPIQQFAGWLAKRRHRPIVALGAPLAEIISDPIRASTVREALTHARRPKDAHEIEVVRRAVTATVAGFEKLRGILGAGISERALQIEFEAECFRAGGTRTGYGTLVGSGPNSAILHCEPSARVVRDREFVLIDAGAEVDRYVADVTRTYVAGQPTAFQKDLYDVVLSAQQRAINRCVAGAEWKDIHLKTAVDLVEGLVSLAVMHGAPESLVEQEIHTLFFPHGLGHLVGLGVRDGSGLFPGRHKDPRPSLRSLRMDLPLAAGYIVTVEPGLYFIPALLNDPMRRARGRDSVNWPLVEEHLGLGGVRIEDNVLITTGAPDVLTKAIPKQL